MLYILKPWGAFLCIRFITGGFFVFNPKINDIYIVVLENVDSSNFKYLKVANEDLWLWHRRLCYFNMDLLKEISKKELVRDLPKIKFEKDRICDACQFGKQVKFLLNPRNVILPQNLWNFYILIYLVLHKLLV